MVQPKSITAADIRQGKLSIGRSGANLLVERRYLFEDNAGDIITEWAGGRVVEEIEISTIPQAILDALVIIDNWTYEKALVKEGMNDP